MDPKNAHPIPLAHDTDGASDGYTNPHHEISQYEEFQRVAAENQALIQKLEACQLESDQKDLWYSSHLASINQQHAQHVIELQRDYFTRMESTTSEHRAAMAAVRMAHSAHANAAARQISDLQLCIEHLQQTIESQQHELSDRAEVNAQMRQVELRTQRLDYVDQFIAKFKSVTKKARLPPPVQSLVTDFMSNELLEDLSTRFLTVGKVAFEMLHYELPIDRLAKVGIYASDKYLELYAHRPPKYNRFVGGNPAVEVNYYTEADRRIIEDAIKRERLDHLGVSANGLNQ